MEGDKKWWESFPNFGKSSNNGKIVFPAADRNWEPILEVFRKQIPHYFPDNEELNLLEIASGTGQHSSRFAPNFPNITFQPSEHAKDLLSSISAYADECSTKNIKQPLHIDISRDLNVHGINESEFDIIYCCNMIHVAPYECTLGLFSNASKYLKAGGIMITYGAYGADGVTMSEGNVKFEQLLRNHDENWGIRSLDKLKILASDNGISLIEIFDLPANNKCIIWQKL